MLQITVLGKEQWDPIEEVFIETKTETLTLEHSLLSISKWESKWKIPFLDKRKKSNAELIDYVRCMTIGHVKDPSIYRNLSTENWNQIFNYINDPASATTIKRTKSSGGQKIITSEVVYAWMVLLNIPFECEKWNFNRLSMLIEVVSEKNAPAKKMSKRDVLSRNKALNSARRSRMHSSG